jgi:hypothetical protein
VVVAAVGVIVETSMAAEPVIASHRVARSHCERWLTYSARLESFNA